MDVEPRALYEQLLRNEEPVRADDHGRSAKVEPGLRPFRLEDSDPEALRDELGRGCRDPPSPPGPCVGPREQRRGVEARGEPLEHVRAERRGRGDGDPCHAGGH